MLVLLFAGAAAAVAQPHWVPLNSTQSKVLQGQIAPRAAPAPAPPPTSAPAAPEMDAPVSPSLDQVAAQATPMEVPVSPTAGAVNRPLQITCMGGGTANKAAVVSAFGSGFASGLIGGHVWSGSSWGSSTIIGTRQQGFGDQVDIRVFTGDDRIRMPRTMLPLLHGGDHGWFKLRDLVADARSIRASAAVGLLNNPKVYIDRVTGTISISGKSGDYAGRCQAIDASAAPKF